MKFIGNILITDPCYVAKDDDWGNSFDYDNYKMPLEIGSYLWESTKFGDGSWTVNQFKNIKLKDPREFIKLLEKEDSDYLGEFYSLSEIEEIGHFTVDSGSFCVCDYDKAKLYNPDFEKTLPKRCYTVIEDFDGEIDFYETEDNRYIYGTGNKTIFTFS